MPRSLSVQDVRRLRIRAQRLDPQPVDPDGGLALVVGGLGGIQAQVASAAALALRARTGGLRSADVERARVEARSIVRTWAMRGTLHLVTAEDLAWLLPLLGPLFVRSSRRRYVELGLDEETYARGLSVVRAALYQMGPLTRAELAEVLASRDLRIEGQALFHLLGRAALEGVICHGPSQGAEVTYVLLDAWVERGPALPRARGLAQLARRYLGAYGPARPEDLAAWSGLSMAEAKLGWQAALDGDEVIEVEIGGSPAWMPRDRLDWLDEPWQRVVRLLPAFDTYLLGYRSRELAVAPEHARRVNAGGGMIRPTVMIDGQAVAVWHTRRRSGGLEIVVEPFVGVDAEALWVEARADVDAEVADLGRFLGLQAAWLVAPPVQATSWPVDEPLVG